MKNYSFWLFVCLIVAACTPVNTEQVEQRISFPKEVTVPQGAVFDYLLFEQDFEHLPPTVANKKENELAQKRYNNKYARKGKYAYQLSAPASYSLGYEGVADANPKKWLRVSCDFMQVGNPAYAQEDFSHLVVSYQDQAADSTIFYQQFVVQELLQQQNKQLVDKWENLAVWVQVPATVTTTTLLKIYCWNPSETPIYIDNLKAEYWTTQPAKAPSHYVKNHIVTEQNYEDATIAGHTKETAQRGVGSTMISKQHSLYAQGYTGTLEQANAVAGDYIHVTFAAFKHHHVALATPAATMVGVVQDESAYYVNQAIDPRIRDQSGQVNQQWTKQEMWFEIPQGTQPNHALKVYGYNPNDRPIYIDDLQIEVWKPSPK